MRKLALIAVLACIVVLGKMCLFTVDSSESPSAEELITHQIMLQTITEPIWLMDG